MRNRSEFLLIKPLAALSVLCAVAIFHIGFTEFHGDISWLQLVSEKIIGGAALYQDVFEVNPPFSVFLYFPSIWLGSNIGVSADNLLTLSVIALFILSAALCHQILARLPQARRYVSFGMFLLAVALFFLPTSVFAQREHIGMIGFLPLAALSARRILETHQDNPLPLWQPIAVGALASVIVCVKPYYALPVICSAVAVCISRNSLKFLFAPEYLVSALFAVLYGGLVVIGFPNYIDHVLPVALAVHTGTLAGTLSAATSILIFAAVPVVGAFLIVPSNEHRHVTMWGALVSIAFMAVCILLGKGWDYHLLPSIVVSYLTLGAALVARINQETQLTFMAKLICAFSAAQLAVYAAMSFFIGTPLKSDLRVLQQFPPGLSMSVATQELTLVHPVARYMDAHWIDRDASAWIVGSGLQRLENENLSAEQRQEIEAHLEQALERKRASFARRPDLIVTMPEDKPVHEFFFSDESIRRTLDDYELVLETAKLAFWQIKPDAKPE